MKEKIKITEETHLIFRNSLNKLHVVKSRKINPKAAKSDIAQAMIAMSYLDIPDENGVYQCAEPIMAKVVRRIETVIFDNSENLKKNPKVVPMVAAAPKPKTKKNHRHRPASTVVSVDDMLKKSPMKVIGAMEKDLAVNRCDSNSIARYVINAIKSQKLNPILKKDNQYHPSNFRKLINLIYGAKKIDDFVVSQFPDTQVFYEPQAWIAKVEEFKATRRDALARILSTNPDFPDYAQADQEIAALLTEAKTAYTLHLRKTKEMEASLQKLYG